MKIDMPQQKESWVSSKLASLPKEEKTLLDGLHAIQKRFADQVRKRSGWIFASLNELLCETKLSKDEAAQATQRLMDLDILEFRQSHKNNKGQVMAAKYRIKIEVQNALN